MACWSYYWFWQGLSPFISLSLSGWTLDKLSSRIFVTLRYINSSFLRQELIIEMRNPNVTWRIIWHVYLFTTELRHACSSLLFYKQVGLTNISYIFNGRRFTKRTFRVSLLSTFRVSRINYSLACSLPIHTWSLANVDGPPAHCQLNPCKMLHKCSTDCIWKGLQPVNDLESHSRSPPLLPFDRPYTISY